MKPLLLCAMVLSTLSCPLSAALPSGLPGALTGGGNFTNGEVNEGIRAQFKALQFYGARRCRMNIYPSYFLVRNDWSRPNPTLLDAQMKLAHEHGIEPLVLFEYNTAYYQGIGFGTYEQWRALGQVYAERYAPGGTWAKENGVADWGVRVFTAVNEPEPGEFRKGGQLGPEPYVAALKGLADGVHGMDKRLMVMPGGFMAANAWNDWTLRGLGPALAPLWNDGTLDGIDLHTYYDVQWAPMEKGYADSAQANFDAVKQACGITRDIAFGSTEYNYKLRAVTDRVAAAGLLTGLWDNLGVVGNDGHTGVTAFAYPWNLFNDAAKDTEYGLRLTLDPYQPTLRGQVLQHALRLAGDLRFVARDPRRSGTYVLDGPSRKLWVWQNRQGWTDHYGTQHSIDGIPAGTRQIEIHGWDGLRRTVPTAGQTSLAIDDLPRDETLMFVAAMP